MCFYFYNSLNNFPRDTACSVNLECIFFFIPPMSDWWHLLSFFYLAFFLSFHTCLLTKSRNSWSLFVLIDCFLENGKELNYPKKSFSNSCQLIISFLIFILTTIKPIYKQLNAFRANWLALTRDHHIPHSCGHRRASILQLSKHCLLMRQTLYWLCHRALGLFAQLWECFFNKISKGQSW